MFVKTGDKVRVIAGKDKGVEAKVVAALPKVNKVVVEGVNLVKNTNVQITKTLKVLSSKKKLQSMYQTFKSWTRTVLLDVLATIVDGKKFVITKNQAKCLTNHEGKEKYNG